MEKLKWSLKTHNGIGKYGEDVVYNWWELNIEMFTFTIFNCISLEDDTQNKFEASIDFSICEYDIFNKKYKSFEEAENGILEEFMKFYKEVSDSYEKVLKEGMNNERTS